MTIETIQEELDNLIINRKDNNEEIFDWVEVSKQLPTTKKLVSSTFQVFGLCDTTVSLAGKYRGGEKQRTSVYSCLDDVRVQ